MLNANGTVERPITIGVPNLVPVPAKYDNQHYFTAHKAYKTEAAVFDPSSGTFTIAGPTGTYTVTFQAGDTPVPADYAGTGSIQPAVFRQSSTNIQFFEKASGTSGSDKIIATFPTLALATVVPVGAPMSYLSSTVVPTTTTQLAVTAQPPATVAAGAGFGLTVTAETSSGAVDPTFNGTVTLSLATNAGGSGTVLGGTLTATAVNGVATFSGLTLNNPGNGYTLKATAGSLTVTTSSFNVASPSATATQLAVTAQPPATVAAGIKFDLTVTAETSRAPSTPASTGPSPCRWRPTPGAAAPSSAAADRDGGQRRGQVLRPDPEQPGQRLQAGGFHERANPRDDGSLQRHVPAAPHPAPPVIIGQSVLFTRKTNRRGKPVGRPILAGFEIDFSTSMNPVTTGNSNNFRLGKYVTRRVGRRTVKVLQPVRFTERFDPSNNSVKLLLTGKKATFPRGGHVTLIAAPPGGISSAAGVLLDGDNNGTPGDNGTFTIIVNARGITRP